jgi:flagellar protein FliO/FliZ
VGKSVASRALPLLTVLLGWPGRPDFAADVPFAAPQVAAATGAGGGLLRTVLALMLVLAAVLTTAWFARRLRTLSGGESANLSVLGQLPLGSRERAVLISVDGQRLLVGVAPGNVRLLHIVAAPSGPTANAQTPPAYQRPSFKSILMRSLGK